MICGAVHGCLLRIDRPGESRLYLSDARFVRKADAKAAACLQAMFQSVGPYIRGLGQDLEGKLTPRMKRWANELISPTLDAECAKVPRAELQFQYEQDVDGEFPSFRGSCSELTAVLLWLCSVWLHHGHQFPYSSCCFPNWSESRGYD